MVRSRSVGEGEDEAKASLVIGSGSERPSADRAPRAWPRRGSPLSGSTRLVGSLFVHTIAYSSSTWYAPGSTRFDRGPGRWSRRPSH